MELNFNDYVFIKRFNSNCCFAFNTINSAVVMIKQELNGEEKENLLRLNYFALDSDFVSKTLENRLMFCKKNLNLTVYYSRLIEKEICSMSLYNINEILTTLNNLQMETINIEVFSVNFDYNLLFLLDKLKEIKNCNVSLKVMILTNSNVSGCKYGLGIEDIKFSIEYNCIKKYHKFIENFVKINNINHFKIYMEKQKTFDSDLMINLCENLNCFIDNSTSLDDVTQIYEISNIKKDKNKLDVIFPKSTEFICKYSFPNNYIVDVDMTLKKCIHNIDNIKTVVGFVDKNKFIFTDNLKNFEISLFNLTNRCKKCKYIFTCFTRRCGWSRLNNVEDCKKENKNIKNIINGSFDDYYKRMVKYE